MGKMKQYLEDLICDECSSFIEQKDYELYNDVIICEECFNKGEIK